MATRHARLYETFIIKPLVVVSRPLFRDVSNTKRHFHRTGNAAVLRAGVQRALQGVGEALRDANAISSISFEQKRPAFLTST